MKKLILIFAYILEESGMDVTSILTEKKISVKSSKPFAKYMLLETKDVVRGDVFDCYVLGVVDEKIK